MFTKIIKNVKMHKNKYKKSIENGHTFRDEQQQTVPALSLRLVLKRDELKDIQRENTNLNLNSY